MYVDVFLDRRALTTVITSLYTGCIKQQRTTAESFSDGLSSYVSNTGVMKETGEVKYSRNLQQTHQESFIIFLLSL